MVGRVAGEDVGEARFDADPEEREETINMSAIYVLLGFVLILLGFAADRRYSLF